MAACANCSRELQPEWKFCVYCGTPTGVGAVATVLAATAPVASGQFENTPVPAAAPASEPIIAPELVLVPAAAAAHGPAPTSHVLRAEDIPSDDPEPAPAAIRPAADTLPHVNILAVLALILGCLVSPLAALFGHLALSQISHTGERGTAIAWVAIVLGYLSLAALLVIGISYLVLNA